MDTFFVVVASNVLPGNINKSSHCAADDGPDEPVERVCCGTVVCKRHSAKIPGPTNYESSNMHRLGRRAILFSVFLFLHYYYYYSMFSSSCYTLFIFVLLTLLAGNLCCDLLPLVEDGMPLDGCQCARNTGRHKQHI